MKFSTIAKSHSNSYKLLKDLSFCVFDLETTGGNQKTDRIIEIGMVRIKNLKIVDEKNFLINPEMIIPEFIQKLTQITQEDTVNAPLIEEVLDEIVEFMGDDVLVAHNSSFDVPFFNSVLKRNKREELKNPVLCTNIMTKYLIPGIMNSNLPYMAELFKIEHKQVHRAVADARVTAQLLLQYIYFFIEKDIKKINQLYYPRNKFELDRCNIMREELTDKEIIEKLTDINSPMLLMFKGDQGLLFASVPLKTPDEEKDFLNTCLSEFPWKNLTIRLMGSFLETLLLFNQHHTKSKKDTGDMVLNYLYKKYNAGTEIKHTETPEEQDIFDQYDFIFSPHLVVDQFTAFSLLNLSSSNPLIFRYPSHKKKLSQYMQSHFLKEERSSKRRNCLTPQVRKVASSFLQNLPANEKEHYLFTTKDEIQNSHRAFFKRLSQFIKNYQYPINYPLDHI